SPPPAPHALSLHAALPIYRIVFAPGTIGTIAFLDRAPEARRRIAHGVVLAGLGDAGPLTYKQTLAGNAFVDRAARHALKSFDGRSEEHTSELQSRENLLCR